MFGCHSFAWGVFWLEKEASDSPPPKKKFPFSYPVLLPSERGLGGLMASGKG